MLVSSPRPKRTKGASAGQPTAGHSSALRSPKEPDPAQAVAPAEKSNVQCFDPGSIPCGRQDLEQTRRRIRDPDLTSWENNACHSITRFFPLPCKGCFDSRDCQTTQHHYHAGRRLRSPRTDPRPTLVGWTAPGTDQPKTRQPHHHQTAEANPCHRSRQVGLLAQTCRRWYCGWSGGAVTKL